jgi:hypothetical protein
MNKATIVTVLLLAVVALGAVLVHHELRSAQERPAVQRQLSRARLDQLAAALKVYRERHAAWPDLIGQLLHDAKLPLTTTMVRGAGVYRYRKPAADAAPGQVVVWSETLHAGVAKGEPWGGEGQVAEADVPPVGYVITSELTVEALDPATHATRIPKASIGP